MKSGSKFSGGPHTAACASSQGREQEGPSTANPLPAPPPFPWQVERAELLLRIFVAVEAKGDGKRGQDRELRRWANRWNGRRYKSNRSKVVRLAYPTLRSIYYAWKREGDAALRMDYKPGMKGSTIGTGKRIDYLLGCLRPGTVSRQQVMREMGVPKTKASAHYRILNARQRKLALKLHRLRMQTAKAERQFQRSITA